ncbi:3'5'-cyclic nucleotide phosphodiesterase [Chloropicon primus]|nr:3'5'-cyclic nucleotide phosphodiesterase [Chloropicon primus]
MKRGTATPGAPVQPPAELGLTPPKPSSSSPPLTRSFSDKRQRFVEPSGPGDEAAAATTTERPPEAYELRHFASMDELETPVWLLNPRSRKNVWGNKAALSLYGKRSVEDFRGLSLAHCEGDFAKPFFDEAARVLSPSRNSSSPSAGSSARSQAARGQLQCRLPGLGPGSPQLHYVFTVRFRGVRLLSEASGISLPSEVCLVTAESSLFNSMNQSLRALEMLKSSPIFTFLFSTEGQLLTANPCAVTFYESFFERKYGAASRTWVLDLRSILCCGDWDETVSYPDNNGPALDPSVQAKEKKAEKLLEHIQHVLFVEKFESFRIQMKMPKRRDPSKHRWVEFEMWAAKDPITQLQAILVNQTNMQETKKLELELKDKRDDLETRNKQLQVELKRAKGHGAKGSLDLDNTVDKTIALLDSIMAGKQPGKEDIQRLKQALRTQNLRAPNRLEEMLLSNKKGFEGEVGLSLFEMLNPKGLKDVLAQPLSARENSNAKKSLSRNSTMDLDTEDEGGNEGGLEPASEDGVIPRGIDQSKPVLEVLETVDDWLFDAFKLEEVTGGHPLSVLACHLFKRLNMFETFEINETQFLHFALKIESGYPVSNAYHNRTHVANVLQSMYTLLTKGLGPEVAGDEEILAGLLAALIHDYEHKGVNNDFLVRFQDDLALKYNDRSPLENHHISAAFDVMLTKPYDIFANTSLEVFIKLRKLVIAMVLATDMKIHFEVLGRFRLIEKKLGRLSSDPVGSEGCSSPSAEEAQSGSADSSGLQPEEVSLALQVCLKCADIGHVYCDSSVHLRWVQKLEQEFFAQGDREEENGAITKSPLMDREKAGITKSQVGFFKVVVVPLFASFCAAFPSTAPMLESLHRNLKLWAKIEEDQLEISEVFDVVLSD